MVRYWFRYMLVKYLGLCTVDSLVDSCAGKRQLGALLFTTTYSDPTDSNRQLRDEGFELYHGLLQPSCHRVLTPVDLLRVHTPECL